MYKIIAIDLDGTLLNSYGVVSNENKEAIQKAREKGTEVILASGRPVMSVENLANDLNCNHFIICGNGAITYDLQKEEIIYNKFLDKEKVLQIIKICEENSIYYNVYTEDTILAKSLNYNVLFYYQENMKKSDDKKTNINIVQDIYKYVKESENDNYLKITICDKSSIIFVGITKKLKEINHVDILEVSHMSRKLIKDGTENVPIEYFYTEITNENVNKWAAIMDIAQRLQVNPEEIMTIGDNSNDEEMLKKAGLGVVMGNSAPHIKEIANIVVADNDNHGVAEAINKYNNEQ